MSSNGSSVISSLFIKDCKITGHKNIRAKQKPSYIHQHAEQLIHNLSKECKDSMTFQHPADQIMRRHQLLSEDEVMYLKK